MGTIAIGGYALTAANEYQCCIVQGLTFVGIA